MDFTPLLLAALAIFISVFTQSTVGFGTAMVGMPLLVSIVGIRVAAPLVALIGLTTEVLLLFILRGHLEVRSIARLVAAAAVGVPLGIWGVRHLSEALVVGLLGVVLVAYALYNLVGLQVPPLAAAKWAYVFGFASGVLGGAYNTSGPPVVIYGTGRRWSPDEFRANLQGFFLVIDAMVVAGHAAAGNLTGEVWQVYLVGLGALAAGMALGLAVGRRIAPETFRKLVLVTLALLGLRLLWATLGA
ncbi:MAG: sulfite exporter TauE/SafE family protein [Caldilineales bacterium]|nr:sulfite exporter TauE/SafE family protein [Caldilineales bacterium]MDW8317586.1 sulfite exporter TauE/SafE family protein [Anaerolineae bacterium]